MRLALTILGLTLWLPELAVCTDTIHHKVHRKRAHHKMHHKVHRGRSDPPSNGNTEVVTVQGPISDVDHSHEVDASSIGPQELPSMPASGPSAVSMAASLDSFGAKDFEDQKSGWDAIKLARANMCIGMLSKHGKDFDANKGKCIAFMDSSCGTNKISTPSGKGVCTEWYKLLAVAPAVSDSKVAGPPEPKARKMAVEEGTAVHAARAKAAATEANKIATDSIHLVDNSKWSLEKARDAVHKARVASAGLSHSQKHSLKTAEAKLKEATKKAEYGQVRNAKYVEAKVENKKLQDMEKKMAKLKKEKSKKHRDELEAMRKEIEELRQTLKKKEGEKDGDDALLKDLQEQIKEMEEAEKHEDAKDAKSHDELKAEIERLRSEIENMQDARAKVEYSIPESASKAPQEGKEEEQEKEQEVEKYNVNMKPLSKSEEVEEEEEDHQEVSQASPVEQKGIDIDTAMPYGDLEPFGREDTAQELTENSIKESDSMVDQLERAEVAEEKRSVFRALTRLRGAAITSFDGVARSQTGNIDEYNKIHKWRNTHPLHHLADEESDISKWAFPDNAD